MLQKYCSSVLVHDVVRVSQFITKHNLSFSRSLAKPKRPVLQRSPTDLYRSTCLPKIKAGHIKGGKQLSKRKNMEWQPLMSGFSKKVACLVIQRPPQESNFSFALTVTSETCEVKTTPWTPVNLNLNKHEHFCSVKTVPWQN